MCKRECCKDDTALSCPVHPHCISAAGLDTPAIQRVVLGDTGHHSPVSQFHQDFPSQGSDDAHAPCKPPPLRWRTGQVSPRRSLPSWRTQVSHVIMGSCRPSAGPLRPGVIPTVSGTLPIRSSYHPHEGSTLCSCNVIILYFLVNNNFLQVFMICSQNSFVSLPLSPFLKRGIFIFHPETSLA